MHDMAEIIENFIQQDPGNRGLGKWAVKGELLPASQSLFNGDHIVITTGFYILSAGVIETDGPPGAIVLAETLNLLGKKVTILIDDHSEKICRKGLEALNSNVELLTVPVEKNVDPGHVFNENTTHFIALERPGMAEDGKYYNFKGQDISAYNAPLDDLFIFAGKKGITTIGIGDGGNELGMGKVSNDVDQYITPDRPFSCKTSADYTICAGVSNWAGYGISALLSGIVETNLMPHPDDIKKIVVANVDAGAVDGVSGKNEPTVDGLKPFWEENVFLSMHSLINDNNIKLQL